MREIDFAFWLHGFFEIRDASPAKDEPMTKEQVQVIKDHLDLVFNKAAPNRDFFIADKIGPLNVKSEPISGGKKCSNSSLGEHLGWDCAPKIDATYCSGPINDAIYAPYDGGVLKYKNGVPVYLSPSSLEEVVAAFSKAGITVCPYEPLSGNPDGWVNHTC